MKLIKSFKLWFLPLVTLLGGCLLVIEANEHGPYEKTKDKVETIHETSRFTWAREVPTANNVWRSGQPDLDSLEAFITQRGIKMVVRLNGGREGEVTSGAEEQLCKRLGVGFFYCNIEAKGNQVNQLMLERIRNIMESGDALVHCLHGYHRAGTAAGYFLAKRGVSRPEILYHNVWEELVESPGRYRRYTDFVLRAIPQSENSRS